MRRFRLDRHSDPTGVSGTGCVALGVLFNDGTVVIRWLGEHATTTIHDSLSSVKRIHLHEGRTTIRWQDKCCFFCGCEKDAPDQHWCADCGASGEPVDEPERRSASWWWERYYPDEVAGGPAR